ncbi:MAG: hypothetical protein IPJ01_10155 [Micavibrio sp.]|nr:hypothetical protein [Micavibrio sp.]
MMKNIFVTYEIAKQLQEKGFNEPCIGMFLENKEIYSLSNPTKDFSFVTNEGKQHNISAPLWQQAEEWLFKQYNIFIEIKRIKVMADPEDDLYVYYCEIGDFSSEHYKMPKQALKKGIEEALKLIKDK